MKKYNFFLTTTLSLFYVLGIILAFPSTMVAAGFASSTEYIVGGYPLDTEIADFDLDNDLDIITSVGSNGGSLENVGRIMLNDGNGVFTKGVGVSTYYNLYSLETGDFDADGDTDIAAGDRVEFRIHIFLNNGSGSFVRSDVLSTNATFPYEMVTADFDGDGDVDLASVHHLEIATNFNVPPRESSVSIYLNEGNGQFTNATNKIVIPETTTTGQRFDDIKSADLDSDGDVDIVMSDEEEDKIYVLTNDGSAHFTVTSSIAVGNQPLALTLFDLEMDGDADAVVVNLNNSVSVLKNNGTGVFSISQTIVYSGAEPSAVVSLDYDYDGDMDVAIGASRGLQRSEISLYRNDSGSLLAEAKIPVNGKSILDIVTGDLNGDGAYDFLTSNGVGNISVVLQQIEFNDRPTLDAIGEKVIIENEELIFTISASDPDGDDVILSAQNLPTGASFNTETGEFSWTPDFNDAGEYHVTFTATEDTPGALSASTTVTITVINFNRAPELQSIGNQTVNEGGVLEFIVSASDPDNDDVTLSALNLPAESSFNAGTGVFTWNTDFDDAGNYPDIEFTATDNGSPMQLDVELVTITVGDVNRLPEITNPGPQQAREEDTVSFIISTSDPDGDNVTLSATNLPSGASFNAATGAFVWETSLSDAGVYIVTFTATDDGMPAESASVDVVITIGDNPTPAEQAEDLIENVIVIDIPQNIENSYLANLRKVEQFILEGKIQAAVNQLNAFINKINQDRQQGILTQEEYDSLLEAAENLIDDLS